MSKYLYIRDLFRFLYQGTQTYRSEHGRQILAQHRGQLYRPSHLIVGQCYIGRGPERRDRQSSCTDIQVSRIYTSNRVYSQANGRVFNTSIWTRVSVVVFCVFDIVLKDYPPLFRLHAVFSIS